MYVRGALVMKSCTVRNNTAIGGAPFGGAMFFAGAADVTIVDSTITANSIETNSGCSTVAYGAAIYTMGKLSIASSTITNNGVFEGSATLEIRGGAIAQAASVNWVNDETALVDLTITTSTLSNNGAARGGAIHGEDGNIRITACAIHDNTGFLYGYGTERKTRGKIKNGSFNYSGNRCFSDNYGLE